MRCNRCGAYFEAGGGSYCKACQAVMIADMLSAPEEKRKEKKENRTLLLIVLFGILFPPLWIIYLLYKNKEAVRAKLASYNSPPGKEAHSVSPSSSTPLYEDEPQKEFIITDRHGNAYRSGGAFRDWADDLVQWGQPFHDARGNLIQWGQPFYDNRDYYITWGSPFYDAGDNYVNPHG